MSDIIILRDTSAVIVDIDGMGPAGPVGPPGAGGADTVLRADLIADTGFTIIKHKRSEANTYARTAAQLDAVKGLDARGVSIMHWIDPALDAAIIAGTNSTTLSTYFSNAMAALSTGGLVHVPAFTFKLDTVFNISSPNTIVEAFGATFTSAMTASSQVVGLTGTGCELHGGRVLLTGSSETPWNLEVTGTYCKAIGVTLEKVPDTGGYQSYIRSTATGFEMRGCRTAGSNGIFCEASDSAFLLNHFKGRASGGDDAIAIKGIQGFTRNVRIIGNEFENLAFMCSIGSEIGTQGANDTTYSKGVGQVQIIGNNGKACSGIAYIKPGAIGPYDYRDGTVDDVVISDNVLVDLAGLKFERGIVITPARGARIRHIKGSNNIITARSLGGSGRLVGTVDIFAIDYRATLHFTSGGTGTIGVGNVLVGATSGASGTVATVTLQSGSWAAGTAVGFVELTGKAGTYVAEDINVTAGQANIATVIGDPSAASISDIDVQCTYSDPYQGQTFAAGTRPGYPVTYVAAVQGGGYGYGSFANIKLDITGDGSSESGVVVDGTSPAMLDEAVEFTGLRLANVNRSAAGGQGGVLIANSIRVSDPYESVVPTSGASFVLTGSGVVKRPKDPKIQAVTSAATVTPTFSDDQVEITAQAVALTLANPSGQAVPDWGIAIRIKDNGTPRAITYGAQYRAVGATLPTTTVASKTLYLGAIWNAADTKLDVVSVAQE